MYPRKDETHVKPVFSLILIITMAAFCIGCGSAQSQATSAPKPEQSPEVTPTEEMPVMGQIQDSKTESEDAETMRMKINETDVEVAWEDNESVEALKELARDSLRIQMSMYGGFEQVGSIGKSLPREDHQTTTQAGDIVLYSGNQLVVFYGSNAWAYTRLGRIVDKSASELTELLGNGDVAITLTLE